MPVRRAASTAVLLAALVGCTTTTPGRGAPEAARGEVALVRGDACGEILFWAASAPGDVVVTVAVDVVGRPAGEPSGYAFDLPHPDVSVTVLTGPGDLTGDLCSDALVGPAPTGEQPVTAGVVRLTVDPPGEECGESHGRLRIDGLVAADGTRFAPVDVSSGFVGCNVGG